MRNLRILKVVIIIGILLASFLTVSKSVIFSFESERNVFQNETNDTANVPLKHFNFEVKGTKALYDAEMPLIHGISLDLEFREPIFIRDGFFDSYVIPIVQGCSIEIKPGYPVLPVNVSIIKLPYGAEVVSVELKDLSVTDLGAGYRVLPGPQALPYMRLKASVSDIWPKSILVKGTYPDNWFEFRVLRGIDPKDLTRYTFVVVHFYPIRYEVRSGKILFAERAKIKVNYQVRSRDKGFRMSALDSNIDVLIVTSKELYSEAIRLAQLKNQSKLKTIVKTVEWIYDNYEGRDEAEKIRNFIKSMVELYGIKFLIIFGDADQVPVRYAWIPDGAYDYDPTIDGAVVETDLYYADLDFSWDDNNDGLWGDIRRDKIDGLPDIIVGRIPVSNVTEARIYINKLIKFDPTSYWFDSALLIGTDTFGIGWPEGEYLKEYASKFIWSNYTVTKLYETAGNLTLTNLVNEINRGYGFINFAGHGYPDLMAIGIGEVYTLDDALRQINGYRLPVIFSMACLTARFGELDSIAEAFLVNPNGGAIAYIGATRLSWGYIGELVTTGLAGEMDWRFTKAFFSDLRDHLGKIWAEMIKGYIMEHPITVSYYGYYLDWKTVAEFVLLGDPTLSLRSHVIENVTSMEETTLRNGEEKTISNALHYQKGDIVLSNATLNILDSVFVMENVSVVIRDNSLLNISDSLIVGTGRIIINNSTLIMNNSVLSDVILEVKNNSIVLIKYSAVNPITTDANSNAITVENSSIILNAALNSTTLSTTLKEGYYKALDLSSTLGLNAHLKNSWLGINLTLINSDISLQGSRLSYLTGIDSNMTIVNSNINMISLVGKSIFEARNSILGVKISISDTAGEISLRNIINEDLILDNRNITGINWAITVSESNITEWFLYVHKAELNATNSKISILEISETDIMVMNSSIHYIDALNSVISIDNSSVMRGSIFGKMNSTASVIGYLTARNAQLNLKNVTQQEIKLYGSNVTIADSLIYYVLATNDSIVTINKSRILSIIALSSTKIMVRFSRVAIIYCRDYSKIILNNVTITFGLRIYDHSKVIAYGSEIWPELILVNVEEQFSNLPYGSVTKFSIAREWNLTIINSYITGWDLLCYNANVTVENSYIFWLFGYYASRIDVR
ncbi:MAG: hypothetical protein DRZ80_01740, partial [Thermoprotei archaeon]